MKFYYPNLYPNYPEVPPEDEKSVDLDDEKSADIVDRPVEDTITTVEDPITTTATTGAKQESKIDDDSP